jgi:hypothetical protein
MLNEYSKTPFRQKRSMYIKGEKTKYNKGWGYFVVEYKLFTVGI